MSTAKTIAAIRMPGFSDPEIVEIVAVAAENLFTNMPSEVAQTEIDVPWCATESPPRKPPRGVSHPRSSRFREPGT